MTRVSHLRSLQAIDCALRAGSLTAAAEELSITPAAVGQRIRQLEDYLGFDLLVRGRSGLKPTAELSKAMEPLRRAFLDLETVAEALDYQRVNELHIAADSDWVELWFNPRLADFRQRYPNLLLCINGEGDVPMRLGPADCEVTFGLPDDNADLLFRDFLTPVSSPENQNRVLSQQRRNRLEGFPLLHLDYYRNDPEAMDWARWVSTFGHRKTGTGRGMRFQRQAPALDAVTSNAGLMIGGLAMLQGQISSGALTVPFGQAGAWTRGGFCARFAPGSLVRTPLRHFRQWLLNEASGTQTWLDETVAKLPPPAAF